MFDAAAINAIPGMIEPVEQQTLYDLASRLYLHPDDQLVEFGTFYGRSTACLAQGLVDNPNRDAASRLHAFDSFSCAEIGGFAPHVLSFAERGKVAHLVSRADGRLYFFPVFEHYLQAAISGGVVVPVQAELADSTPEGIQRIALMHIDSPKFYEELKIVLHRFFPLLRERAVVVFQDFFYHWSATLIAAVEAMRQLGWLEYKVSVASSLVTQMTGSVSHRAIGELDLLLARPGNIEALIMDAIGQAGRISVDRPEIFVPRLWLAGVQHLWSEGRSADAADLVSRFFSEGGKVSPSVLADFLEMMREGFSTRHGYQRDHG